MFSVSLAEFCNKIILPPDFEIKNLTKKDKCYIVGNKGVGKTAVLFYINNMLLMDDPLSKCSMILFKSHISTTERAQMEKLEQLRITNMNIEETELEYVLDFTRLRTLAIYKKVAGDNKDGDIPKGPICYDTHQTAFIGNDNHVNYPKDAGDYSLSCFYEAKDFARAMPEYSRQSKGESIEELEAIYTSTEIDQIFICLTAYKKYNSFRKTWKLAQIKRKVI